MGLQLNLKNVKGDMDDVKSPGFAFVPDGRGMVLFNEFREYQQVGKATAHKAFFEVTAWSATDESGKSVVGSVHEESIFLPASSDKEDKSIPKLLRLAIALGAITPEKAEEIRSGAGEFEFDPQACLHRPLFIEITTSTNKDDPKKQYHQIADFGCAYYHIGDPRCADWPKNVGVLSNYGAACGAWQPLPKKVQPAAPATGAANPFAARK